MLGLRSGFFRFKWFGVSITVDAFLPIALAVICWVLAKRYFPGVVFLNDATHYWILGGIGSFALLLSILFHEVGHAFSAKILQIPIERIHIYLFGGMVELRHRPLIPNQEFFVSMAGPIASGLLALIGFIILTILNPQTQALFYFSVHFISYMNLLLAVFNLIPVFPLDGGRAMRALMWQTQKNFYKASRTMHRFSSTFIGLVFVISLILFFYVTHFYAFWLGIFGLYTAYLLMKAKTELTTLPQFSELVFKIERDSSPAQIIQKILDVNPEALKKAIVPVFIDQQIHSILFAHKAIENMVGELDFSALLEPVRLGTYIETSNENTFSNEITYEAEFLPVFENNIFVGLCDAFEMRFWLLETKFLKKS